MNQPLEPRSTLPIGPVLLLLWLVALVLATAGLGDLPLRDWDEGIVARVALETSWSPWPERLLPSYWGEPYLNKPPGLHWLMAAGFEAWRQLGGHGLQELPPEWLVRLAPALLSSLLVPLIGLLQLRLRPGERTAAVCSALIALTLLPLARHGRLAMLDGVQLLAMVLLWLGLLRAQRRRAKAAGLIAGGFIAGLAASGLLLLKAPVVLPVLASGLLLRLLDRDLRGRDWAWLGLGLALGLAPGLAWHGWHLLQRGDQALVMWGGQGLSRLTSSVESHSGGPIEPLLEVLEGGWPWLPLWPFGLALAWRQRRERAGRWSLGLSLATAWMVLPLQTQLPWYSLLLWPPFCLVCAPVLASILSGKVTGVLRRLPWFWGLLGLVLLATSLLILPAAPGLLPGLGAYRFLPFPAGLGLAGGALLLVQASSRRRRQGLLLLAAGWCVSLLLLFLSPLWIWELNEHWSVLPAAELARSAAAPGDAQPLEIFMEGKSGQRPSLRWYAGRAIAALPKQADGAIPADFLLIRQEPSGLPAALLTDGTLCRLEAVADQSWQRWRCSTKAPDF